MNGSLLNFRTDPIPEVRIGLIGTGSRGCQTIARYVEVSGARIVCLADINEENLARANKLLTDSGRPAARTICGAQAWQEICRQENVDIVYICTDWASHAKIACEAMENGKHVAVEVPAATTVSECRKLVEVAEKTRRHCFMTENCCYDFFFLANLEMARQGKFGDIRHCEGAYIHHLEEESPWMMDNYAFHGGNPYPTHGLGPIGLLLNIHRGDRLDYLVSVTTSEGCINNTLIRTVLGRTILLQLDVTTPRNYSRIQTICGSRGYSQRYPLATLSFDDGTFFSGEAALEEAHHFFHSHAAKQWQEGHDKGVINEMNYAMDRRLVYCLRNGLPLDIDVYDAAEWSCIAELSRQSAQNNSQPVAIPDFTNGHWQDIKGHCFF